MASPSRPPLSNLTQEQPQRPSDNGPGESSTTPNASSQSMTGHHVRARTSKLLASGKTKLLAQDWKGKASSAKGKWSEAWNGGAGVANNTPSDANELEDWEGEEQGGLAPPGTLNGRMRGDSGATITRTSTIKANPLPFPKQALSSKDFAKSDQQQLSGPSGSASSASPASPSNASTPAASHTQHSPSPLLAPTNIPIPGPSSSSRASKRTTATEPPSPLLSASVTSSTSTAPSASPSTSPFFGPIDAGARKIGRGIGKVSAQIRQKSLPYIPSAVGGISGAGSGIGGSRPGTPPAGPLVAASPGVGPGWIGTVGSERDGDIPVAMFSTAANNADPSASSYSSSTSPKQREPYSLRSSTDPVGSPRSAAAAFSTISLPTASSSTSTTQPQYVPVAPGLPSHAPGSTVPILLPGYATRKIARDRFPQTWAAVDKPEDLDDGEVEVAVFLQGMVLKTMEQLGTRQRVFNQMAKQLAGLPKVARRGSALADPLSSSPASSSGLQTPSAGPVDPESTSFFDDEKPLVAEPSSVASADGQAQEETVISEEDDNRKNGAHRHGNFGDRLTKKLMEGVDDAALLKMIERAGILPNEQPIEEVMSGPGKGDGAEWQDEGRRHRASVLPFQSAPASPAVSPMLTPTLPEASATSSAVPQGRRERAMAKLSALRTMPLRSDTNSKLATDSSIPSPIGSTSSSSTAGSSKRPGGASAWAGRSLAELQSLQRNLDSRLRAFWTFRVEHREVRIEIEPVFSAKVHEKWKAQGYTTPPQPRLLATTALWTNGSGRFEHKLTIPWYMLESFCKHHETTKDVHPIEIASLRIRAVLMEHKNPFQKAYEWATTGGSHQRNPDVSSPVHDADAPLGSSFGSNASEAVKSPKDPFKNHVDSAATPWLRHDLDEDGPDNVQIVSDVDDTVKHTDITSGLRAVFHNVFVKSFEEVTIDGIAKWYQAMRATGAGIHYVSNAPLELYGLVRGFMEVAGLPIGHLHLKMYPTGARNLLASYLEPAGERKRGAVQAILDEYKQSKFILIGDSGELDLELYSQLAFERPDQIKAIYIRDVSTPRPRRKGSIAPDSPSVTPLPSPSMSTNGLAVPGFFDPSFTQSARSSRPPLLRRVTGGDPPSATSTGKAVGPYYLTEAEYRRRETFRARAKKARELVPKHIKLEFYRTGDEVEAQALGIIREVQEAQKLL